MAQGPYLIPQLAWIWLRRLCFPHSINKLSLPLFLPLLLPGWAYSRAAKCYLKTFPQLLQLAVIMANRSNRAVPGSSSGDRAMCIPEELCQVSTSPNLFLYPTTLPDPLPLIHSCSYHLPKNPNHTLFLHPFAHPALPPPPCSCILPSTHSSQTPHIKPAFRQTPPTH